MQTGIPVTPFLASGTFLEVSLCLSSQQTLPSVPWAHADVSGAGKSLCEGFGRSLVVGSRSH